MKMPEAQHSKPLEILDVIHHRNRYYTQRFLVLNRRPVFCYERVDGWLIAEDSGFFDFYHYGRPSGGFVAFAGRKFDIPMQDGSTEKAYGQWWFGTPPDYRELVYGTAYGTPEGLAKCNVFCSIAVDRDIVDAWLSENTPSNNYFKYKKGHSDFGEHMIESQWVERQVTHEKT